MWAGQNPLKQRGSLTPDPFDLSHTLALQARAKMNTNRLHTFLPVTALGVRNSAFHRH